jgi:putative ABC transport system permease protein
MAWLNRIFPRRRRYEDLAVSIQEHIAERAEELIEEGMSKTDAEQQARREFGNVCLIQQRSREAWQWPTLESILADVRFALRQLIKSPGFTATAVITLALGIAINATMFSMVSGFLMGHVPARDPERVVVLSSVNPDGSMQPDANPVSAVNYLDWKQNTRMFPEMAASSDDRAGSLSAPGEQPEAIGYSAVTANYFSTLGVAPQLGRGFVAGEDEAGHDHVAVLSHSLWERRYGSDPSVIGRTVRLNREDYVIAGVMPQDFRMLGFSPKLWTPLVLAASDRAPEARSNRYLHVFARLAPGVTLKEVRAQMQVVAQQAQRDFPATESRWGASARTMGDFLIYDFGIRQALAIIMTVVVFVLLIACANVAGLLLTRAVGRQKELAVRMALGASRIRMVRQLLTEGLMIALMGGVLGVLLSYFGIRLVRTGLSFNDAISEVPVSLDKNVMLYAAAISIAAALLSSLVPAVKASRAAVNADLKNETRGGSAGRSHGRLRAVLVGGQIAMALFLLTGSGLLIRGVYLLDHQKLGFTHEHLLTAGVALDQARYPDASKQKQFAHNLTAQIEQIPRVESVAVASDLPATGPGSVPIHVKDREQARANEKHTSTSMVVSPEYFSVAGVPILRGRGFTAADHPGTPRVAVVSQEFVRRYFPGQDAIGKQIELDIPGSPAESCEIIGIASDVKSFSEFPQIDPAVYESFEQRPLAGFSVMVRSSADPATLADSLRSTVAGLDPELPLLRVMSMDGVIDAQRNGNPLFEKLLATFAVLALILSAIGIYGLIAYSVGQRTQEIGIRMALGAKAADISRMVLREGLKIAAIGSAIGIAIAIPLPKVFNAMFSGLIFGAPAVYPVVLTIMLIVALAATFVPAYRAARVDPSRALRND